MIDKDQREKAIGEDVNWIKLVGIIEKASFDIIPHMIVIIGEERIWLEGPIEAFEGKKEDYTIGKTIVILGKNVGTMAGNCDLGKIECLPLYVADWVTIKDKKHERYEKVAEILVKDPHSGEVLLILNDEGPKTADQLIKDIDENKESEIKITLGKLREPELIDHNGDIVWITSFGEEIVKKLRKLEKEL